MRRALLLFVVLGVLTLSASLPASTQEGEPQQGAAQYDPGVGEAQYAQEEVAAAGCGWYWGFRWNSAGAWEWWCWDPEMGWWYGTNESGSKQFAHTNRPGSFINVR
jgi:hypothetical protein